MFDSGTTASRLPAWTTGAAEVADAGTGAAAAGAGIGAAAGGGGGGASGAAAVPHLLDGLELVRLDVALDIVTADAAAESGALRCGRGRCRTRR